MAKFVADTHTEVINIPEPTYYGVSNPHPMFGKDPNVVNEMGHTTYPMWVDTEVVDFKLADGTPVMKRVKVKDKKEHEALTKKIKGDDWKK